MISTRIGWAALALGVLALTASTAALLERRRSEETFGPRDGPALEDLRGEIAELRLELASARREHAPSGEPRAAPALEAPPAPLRDEAIEKILARLSSLEVRAANDARHDEEGTGGPGPKSAESTGSSPERMDIAERRARSRAIEDGIDERLKAVRHAIVTAGVSEEASRELAREVDRWETGLAEIGAREEMGEDVSREILDFQASIRSRCSQILSPADFDAFASSFPHLAGHESDQVDENPPPPSSQATPPPPRQEPVTRPAGEGR